MKLAAIISDIKQGHDLTVADMEPIITAMMEGSVEEAEMADFLLALKEKGEAVSEIIGAARAMRAKMTKIESDHPYLLDTCGTGGDGSGTFNISTAAAIVVSACGIPIAKHGNRAISSKSGSADALKEMGVNVTASKEVVEVCLREIGLCFCFAPLFHESVKNVGAARKKLGVPTIFNMLGPLCNPAGANFQMIGVGKPWQRDLIAQAVQGLGTEKSIVVHGNDGLCEVSNAASTDVSIVTPETIEHQTWSPEDFGESISSRKEIEAVDAVTSANLIKLALQPEPSTAKSIVVINSAAAIWLRDTSRTLNQCADLAREAISQGRGMEKLNALIQASN